MKFVGFKFWVWQGDYGNPKCMIVSFYGVWGFLKGLLGILWCLRILKMSLWNFVVFVEWGIWLHNECDKLFLLIEGTFDLDYPSFYFLKVVNWRWNLRKRQVMKEACQLGVNYLIQMTHQFFWGFELGTKLKGKQVNKSTFC